MRVLNNFRAADTLVSMSELFTNANETLVHFLCQKQHRVRQGQPKVSNKLHVVVILYTDLQNSGRGQPPRS